MNSAATRHPPVSGTQDLLMIDGMFCGGCAASLEQRLKQLSGVASASVDLAAGAALVQWKPGEADSDTARQAIAALGYAARDPDSPAASGSEDPVRALQMNLVIAAFFGMWTMLPSIGLYLGVAPDPSFANGLAWSAAIASLPVVAYAGLPFYRMAFATLRAGAGGIDALVSLGVFAALLLSGVSLAQGGADVYFEVAVALITLQLLARLIQFKLARAGRDALARLLDLAPPQVLRVNEQGAAALVPAASIVAGDLLVVDVGETLAADGIVDSGEASLDRHFLTGESAAVSVLAGEAVCAGEVVLEGPLMLRVSASAGERRVDALARQVRTLLMRKPDWQRLIDVVARYFLLIAALAAVAGGLLAAQAGESAMGIAERALAVFVIACPCALSLAAPLAGLGATRRAGKLGMLLRDLRVLTAAGRVNRVFVDKTGTLTEGRPRVAALCPLAGVSGRELLSVAAQCESHSRHPLALAIVDAALEEGIALENPADPGSTQRRTVVGGGVSLRTAESLLRVGSEHWFQREGLHCPPLDGRGFSRVWVARGDRVLGAIDLDDPLRAGAADAIKALQGAGMVVTMFSGDAPEPVERLARRLGIEGHARCSPEDKVRAVEIAAREGGVTAFVGDGLNDGPAIAAADLGVAVENALDAARTASAATLLRGGVERLPELLALLGSAGSVLRQNLVWAIAYNALAVPAALFGWVHPAVAALAMAASSITIVLNSLRVR